MPKQFVFVLLGLLLVQTASAQDSKPTSKPEAPDVKKSESYELQYKFKAGEKRLYQLKATYNQAAGIVVMTGEHKLEEHCQSVDEKTGKAQVTLESKWVQRTNNTRGHKYKSNSDQLDKKDEREKAFYKALLEKRSVSVNSRGHIARKLSTAKAIDRNLIHWVVGGVEYLPFDYLNLPGKAVQIGDSWTHVFKRSLEGPGGKAVTFVTTYTWTLKGVKKGDQSLVTMAIEAKTKIQFLDGEPAKPLKIKEGKGTGTVIFNLSQGHIQSVEFAHGLKFLEGTQEIPLKHHFSARFVKGKGKQKDAKPAVNPNAAPGESYKLRYKFAKGKSRHYKLKATYNQGEGSVVLKSRRRYEEHCESVDEKTKLSQIELKSPWLERSNNTRQFSKTGSSDDFDKMGQDEKERFMALMAKRVVSVSPLGKVVRTKTAPVKRLDKDLVRWTLAGIDAVPYDYLVLPDKAVKLGDSWTNVLKKTLEGPGGNAPATFITTFTWTLKDVKKADGQTLMTIALSSQTALKFLDGQPRRPLSLKESVGEGTVIFNVSEGQVQSVNFAQSLNLVEGRGGVLLKYSFAAESVKKQ